MKVLADRRERDEHPGILEALRGRGAEVEVLELEAGDYYFPETAALVEYKTVTDFLRRLRDRSLWGQLEGMKRAEGATPFLLLEGPLTLAQKFTQWSESAVAALVASIQRDWGVHVLPSPNVRWTVAYLLSLGRTRTGRDHPLRYAPKNVPLWQVQRGVIEGIPDVSSVRAEALLEHFGTVRAVACATPEELQQVRGIGEKIAARIYEVMNSPFSRPRRET